MDYIHINSFILGTICFALLFLSNVVNYLLCIYNKIKINKFTVFFNPWFSFHKENIGGIKFSLGWLPLGCYVKILGMKADDEEKKKFSDSELPFTFFTKPKYFRTLFSLIPWLIFVVAFFLSLILYTRVNGFGNGLKNIIEFIILAFKTMFENEGMRDAFVDLTKEITTDKNIILFDFLLLTFYMVIMIPISLLLEWFNDENTKSKIRKVLGYILTIGGFWILFWKIPKFVFSFFEFDQSIIFILSFIIGLFSIGLVCYFVTLFLVKTFFYKLHVMKEQDKTSHNNLS